MKTTLLLVFSLLISIAAHAESLEVSLEVNKEDGRCVLKIRNTSPEAVTILKAFDRESGMSANLPMGTEYRFEETEEWIASYSMSSSLWDHGPSYKKDKDGKFIAGPKQPLVLLAPKEEISTEFSLEVAIRWMWDHVEKRKDGTIRMEKPFFLRAGVFLQKSENEYDFISASSDKISYPLLFDPDDLKQIKEVVSTPLRASRSTSLYISTVTDQTPDPENRTARLGIMAGELTRIDRNFLTPANP